jgi:hypothetical protein
MKKFGIKSWECLPSIGSESFHLLYKNARINMNITVILPVVLCTGATLIGHYVCFKDDESYEDKEGTACNLHVTWEMCTKCWSEFFKGRSV